MVNSLSRLFFWIMIPIGVVVGVGTLVLFPSKAYEQAMELASTGCLLVRGRHSPHNSRRCGWEAQVYYYASIFIFLSTYALVGKFVYRWFKSRKT